VLPAAVAGPGLFHLGDQGLDVLDHGDQPDGYLASHGSQGVFDVRRDGRPRLAVHEAVTLEGLQGLREFKTRLSLLQPLQPLQLLFFSSYSNCQGPRRLLSVAVARLFKAAMSVDRLVDGQP